MNYSVATCKTSLNVVVLCKSVCLYPLCFVLYVHVEVVYDNTGVYIHVACRL